MIQIAVDRAWEFCADVVIRSCLLLLVAGACLFLLRNAAAASRHLILTLLFGSLLVLPILSAVAPPWSVDWRLGDTRSEMASVPSRNTVSSIMPRQSPIDPRTVTHVSTNAWPARISTNREVRLRDLVRAAASANSTAPHRDRASTYRPALAQATAGAYTAARSSHFLAMQVRPIKALVLLTWLAGCATQFLRMFGGVIGTARLRRKGRAIVDETIQHRVAEARAELNLRGNLVLLQTDAGTRVSVPITWGVFRPVLLLPGYLIEWPQDRLRGILLHEMAHIRRQDWGIQLMAQIGRALYWFHPPVRWAAQRLYLEAERACDDRVLLAGMAPSVYAGTLLEVIRTMKSPVALPKSALSAVRPPIESRLYAILTPRHRQGLSRPAALLVAVGAATCVVALASVRVGATSRTTPTILQSSEIAPVRVPTDRAHVSPVRQILVVHRVVKRAAPVQMVRAQVKPVRTQAIVVPAAPHAHTKVSSKPVTDARDTELKAMRKQLETIKRLLFQNQNENRQLREQLISLKSLTSSALANPTEQHPESSQQRQRQPNAKGSPILTASQQARIDTIKMTLQDLHQQRSLLQQKLLQVQSLYKQGVSGPNPVTQTQAELTNNRVAIDSALQQLAELESGIHRSQRDQQHNTLQLQIKKLKDYLLAQQEELKRTQLRYQAGLATEADVTDVHQSVSRTRVEIDNLQLQLLESE